MFTVSSSQIAPFALIAAIILLPLGDAVAQTSSATRTVAITFDDLPATSAGVVSNDVTHVRDVTRRLLNAIGRFRIPAVGFVNEAKLEGATGEEVAARVGLLQMWLAAGLELGNHTYSHRDLNHTPREQFEADVIRGEAVTRKLMKDHDRSLRYFRHPFLHVGADLHERRGFEAFLARHGYIVAPVTIDNDDFVYAAAYARALRRGDTPGAMRIGDDYVRYMAAVVSYFEDVSRRVTGREIPQILLLHANSLNADRFSTLAELLVRRGYRFVSLDEALKDEVYRLPDDFVGAPSNSWFNHWAITAGRQPVPTPAPPAWIQDLTREPAGK